ncbi:MAG: EAL domain-containing protein [Candidatus Brocadiales bacterium]
MGAETTNILVIEDNPGDARLVQEMLGEAHQTPFDTECAGRLSTALERLVKGGIDLVLLDLSLPDCQGLDTFGKINVHAPNLPIVVLSGTDDEKVAVEAVRQGAQDYLVKGQVDSNLLTRSIRYAIERKRTEDALKARAQQQAAVAKVGQRALAGIDLQTLMDEIATVVANTLGVAYCKVLELLPDSKALLLRAGVGWKEGYVGHATVGADTDSQAGYTLLSNEPVIVKDLRTETRFSGSPLLLDHGVVSGMSTIIPGKNRPFGVLGAHTARQRTFAENDINFLQSVANVLSETIEREWLSTRLDYMASYDALTGLPNRTLFVDLLRQAMVQAQSEKRQLAVLYICLSRLSSIFELIGREVYDILFKTVGERLKESLSHFSVGERGIDVGRLRENEFAVLLPEIKDAQDASRVAQRICSVLSDAIVMKDQKCLPAPSIGIGIAIYPSDGDNEEDLIKNARVAMPNVRGKGRNDFQFYSPAIGAVVSERMALQNDLREALEKEELLVYYQPQADLGTGQIVGMEALVRWRHPAKGLISPAEFIPIAEDNGLIIPIGEWVLRTACRQNRAWYDAGRPPIRMSVNVTAHQFEQQNLVGIITSIVKETGLDPHYLELEITESTLMKGRGTTLGTLSALNEMGMQITIDDFGTGYSSLSYLKRMPVTKLKIDQSFIRDIARHFDSNAIVAATIAMAHSMRIETVAEGVETVEQLEFLRSLKCDVMQGSLFSQPVPAEEVTKLLAAGKRLEL